MSIQIDYQVALIGYVVARLNKLGEQPYELAATLCVGGHHDGPPVPSLWIERVLNPSETRRVGLELNEYLLTVNFFDVKGSREYAVREPTHCSPNLVREQCAFIWSEIAHHLRI